MERVLVNFVSRSWTWLSAGSLFVLGGEAYGALSGPDAPSVHLSLLVVLAQCLLVWLRVPAARAWLLGILLFLVFIVSGDGPATGLGMCQLLLLNAVASLPRWRAVTAAGTTFAVGCLVMALHEPFPVLGLETITLIIWTAGAAGIGTALRSRRQYVAAVEERARWALETREAEAHRRVAEERLRIARDLHDVLGHQVAVIRLHTGLARRTLHSSPERAESALREAESATQMVLREMSSMLKVLRDSEFDGPAPPAQGLDDIDTLVQTLRKGGMDVLLHRRGDTERVPELVAMTAYRVSQELLTNARRHGAGPVTLTLDIDADVLRLRSHNAVPAADAAVVRDRDVTRDPEGGYGLIGMRERVRTLGGRLSVSRPDGTFTVTAELPLSIDAPETTDVLEPVDAAATTDVLTPVDATATTDRPEERDAP
ncbi:histidine kinase [Kineosporia rhizophila]|uniref:sensor histidine kinase n=1 Tax=Kineosporia rhizophila TaxID=84633 RepID=UPI001E3BFA37|nr:histidine kinase [Kineosporia rhizophila]